MASILNDLDLWQGTTEVSDKIPEGDKPVAYIPRSYQDKIKDSISLQNPDTGQSAEFPVQYVDDEDQKRIRLSAPAMSQLQLAPGQQAKMNLDPFRKKPQGTQEDLPQIEPGKTTFYYPETPENTKAAGLSYSMEGGIKGGPGFSDVDLREHTLEMYNKGKSEYVAVAMAGRPTGEEFLMNIGGQQVRAKNVDTGGGLRGDQVDVATSDPELARSGLASGETIRGRIGSQPQGALLAGDQPTAASLEWANDPEKLKSMKKTKGVDGFTHYNDPMNTRVNKATGTIMQDIGGHTVVYQSTGGGKFQTHWLPKSDNPEDTVIKKAAEKGVVRRDYPEGPEGEKQFQDEAKLVLGAGVADDIAEGIMNGTQPPTTQGLYRNGPQVRAKLARQGYDLKNAELDYKAVIRHMASMNSPQMTKFYQATQTAHDSLDVIDELASQWKAKSAFGPLNKVRLVSAANGAFGEEQASLALKLQAQISDLTSEIAQVYMGGGTPTDHALQIASQNLSADWSEKQLHDMTDQARKNLRIRLNSLNSSPVLGLAKQSDQPATSAPASGPNAAATPAPSATPKPDKIKGHYYKDSKGNALGYYTGDPNNPWSATKP